LGELRAACRERTLPRGAGKPTDRFDQRRQRGLAVGGFASPTGIEAEELKY